MKQNSTWMRFLALGIIFSLLVINISCKKHYFRIGEFHFLNKTAHKITFDDVFKQYNLEPNQSIIIKQTQDAERRPHLEDYYSPFIIWSKEPINIKFNSNKCAKIAMETENSVLNIQNFLPEKVDDYTYKFTYTFTEADYNRAVACP